MKSRIVALALILLLVAGAAAVNDEALNHAASAPLPSGLSQREAQIYRQAYAEGYYAALYPEDEANVYILNKSSRKFHLPSCSSAKSIKESNRVEFHGTRDQLIADRYEPCGNCEP